MKKGYFELGYVLVVAGYGIFAWIARSREQMETAAAATRLRSYLADRLGGEAEDLQALSNAKGIEDFLHSEGGTFFVVLYTWIVLLALSSFTKTKLCSAMMTAFSRAWTWRP